jgi:hypothetical protein
MNSFNFFRENDGRNDADDEEEDSDDDESNVVD